MHYDARAIDEDLAHLGMLMDGVTLYEKIVSPLVVEVGDRWREGRLSVAHEHMLSERLEITLRASLRRSEREDGPVAVLSCIEGESHVLGMLGAALRFAASGARVIVLGAATPPSAIADFVRATTPRVVGLSMAVTPRDPKTLFKSYAKACGSVSWVVGGPSAEAMSEHVTRAGGLVALGEGSAWQSRIRDWLRGAA
jgi:hypothetical protein